MSVNRLDPLFLKAREWIFCLLFFRHTCARLPGIPLPRGVWYCKIDYLHKIRKIISASPHFCQPRAAFQRCVCSNSLNSCEKPQHYKYTHTISGSRITEQSLPSPAEKRTHSGHGARFIALNWNCFLNI